MEQNTLSRRLLSFFAYLTNVYNAIFGREGLLGVDHAFLEPFQLVRELVVTILQLVQVYRMSYLLPRLWLIRCYVVLMILNCWSTPLVHGYYHDHHTQRRLLTLLCDAVLDMVSSIGVSSLIFITYVPQYTDPTFGFPLAYWFDDLWFTNMQHEFQKMIVTSWMDMMNRLVFAMGLLQCMESIKDVLTPGPTHQQISINRTASVEPSTGPNCALREEASHTRSFQQRRTISKKTLRTFLVEKMGLVVFIVIGLAVLIIHIISETYASSTTIPCQLTLHPWLVNKPSCALLELDCHELGGISGAQASLQNAWNTFEFTTITTIAVRHCPQLEIPPTLQQFHEITSFKLHNCSIASWSTDAALTSTDHQHMRALFFVRTVFPNGELPSGLLHHFPTNCKSSVTSVTNLYMLPDNLDESWPQGMTLVFERSQMRSIPSAILNMNATTLSFGGSAITIFTQIQELPRFVVQPSPFLQVLFLDGTSVSTFWSWMDSFIAMSMTLNSQIFFNAHCSRYCTQRDEIVAGNRTTFEITTSEPDARDLASVMDVSTPEKLHFAMAAVTCEHGAPFYFSLDEQDATSAIQ